MKRSGRTCCISSVGATGRSNVYRSVDAPDFQKLSGRDAARTRGEELDRLAETVRRSIARFPSGLDPRVQAARKENKRRILSVLGGSSADWKSHRWQLTHLIRDAETLGSIVRLTPEERKAITLARKHHLPFAITPYYASLMDRDHHRKRDHAVRAQVIPPMDYVTKMIDSRGDSAAGLDYMGEGDTSPVDLVTRRYPQIAIFKPFNTCAQICVYCQRNWEIDDAMLPGALASKDKIAEALAWFRRETMLEEVLITGGDPLMLPDKTLAAILKEFASMKHIQRIRIGSRAPVVLPMRFTPALLRVFRRFHRHPQYLALMTHCEHPYEITPDMRDAVAAVRDIGIGVYNQQVFTIENSRKFESAALRRALKSVAVDPYYTFGVLGKQETDYYRVPIARILQERKEEARLIPGIVRTDEPVINLPRLGKNYLRAGQDHIVIALTPDGSRVYEFLPWEKNLYPSPTSLYLDVPIFSYLERLKALGEDPDDYANIYYYF